MSTTPTDFYSIKVKLQERLQRELEQALETVRALERHERSAPAGDETEMVDIKAHLVSASEGTESLIDATKAMVPA